MNGSVRGVRQLHARSTRRIRALGTSHQLLPGESGEQDEAPQSPITGSSRLKSSSSRSRNIIAFR